MRKRIVAMAGLSALAATLLIAADISGKWTGDMPGRGGETMPTSFTFKADGDKLTGTMTGPQATSRFRKAGSPAIRSFSTTLDFGGNS